MEGAPEVPGPLWEVSFAWYRHALHPGAMTQCFLFWNKVLLGYLAGLELVMCW